MALQSIMIQLRDFTETDYTLIEEYRKILRVLVELKFTFHAYSEQLPPFLIE